VAEIKRESGAYSSFDEIVELPEMKWRRVAWTLRAQQ